MLQSLFCNLGILLLMHTCISTSLHLNQQKKIPDFIIPVLYTIFISGAIITMYFFPVKVQGHIFDLRIIPIVTTSIYHGWKKTLPMILFVSLVRFLLGGNMVLFEIAVTILIPFIFSSVYYPVSNTEKFFGKPFLIIMSSWFFSDAIMLGWIKGDTSFMERFFLYRCGAVALAALVMTFFRTVGARTIEMSEQLIEHAERDPLTGLYNMRKFEAVVQNYKLNEDEKMFIAMVDIDFFKNINDTFGHQVGDEAIIEVGKIFRKYCTKEVMIGRYGGDEFIIFIAASSKEQAIILLDFIRKEVSKSKIIPQQNNTPISIKLSIGITELIDKSLLKEAIGSADYKLYLSKSNGRNQICG